MTNWFQTDAAYRLFQSSQGEFTPLLVASEHCRCVVAITGAWYSRRGIIQGGIQIDPGCTDDELRRLLHDVEQQCRAHACIYIEVRCFDDYSAYRSLLEHSGWLYRPHYDVIIDTTQPTPDAKMRQIRRALADGQQWREAATEQDVRLWYECLSTLYRQRVRRPVPSLQFFLNAWQTHTLTFLLTEHQGRITGGTALAVHRDTAYEWYICGQVLSTWAAIEWCRQHDIPRFDTMGAGQPGIPYGVRDFKLQMGGRLHEWGRYLRILRPALYRLGTTAIRLAARK